MPKLFNTSVDANLYFMLTVFKANIKVKDTDVNITFFKLTYNAKVF